MTPTAVLFEFSDKALLVEYHHRRLVKGIKCLPKYVETVFHLSEGCQTIGRKRSRDNASFSNMLHFEVVSQGIDRSLSANAWLIVLAHAYEVGDTVLVEERAKRIKLLGR